MNIRVSIKHPGLSARGYLYQAGFAAFQALPIAAGAVL
jgi:hypothetical protein